MRELIVVAHPDDEVLGCGGTIQRMNNPYVFFMGAGRPGERNKNMGRIQKVSQVLGYEYVCHAHEDNLMDRVALKQLAIEVGDIIHEVKPDIVYTHYEHDLNQDHRAVYQAVMIAARPGKSSVRAIYSFEVLSSTNWVFSTTFTPDLFVDLSTEQWSTKADVMEIYDSEIDASRDARATRILAEYRGLQCGCAMAEAFKTVRRFE